MFGTVAKSLYLLSASLLILSGAPSAQALVINNYFSTNLKTHPRAIEIIAAINYSSAAFEALLANEVTVNIKYDIDRVFGFYLGLSGSAGGSYTKDIYVEMMAANAAANPQNTVLASALGSLDKGNYANPDLTEIVATSAELRANGIPVVGNLEQFVNEDGTPVHDLGGDTIQEGGLDGVVTIASLDEMLFGFDIPTYDGTPSSIFYPAINTIQHEIMHVLGGGNSNIGSDNIMTPLDLYRYAGPGEPEFADTKTAYFSIDGGVTKIQDFNSSGRGDANGWGPIVPCQTNDFRRGGPIGLFMSSSSCPNQPVATFSLDSPEGISMMAIGWNPRVAAVPEPATWAMIVLGFGAIGAALRRRGVGDAARTSLA